MSLLTSSYMTTGGLNAAQAGISVSGGQRMTGTDWKAVCNRMSDPKTNYLKHIKPNGMAYLKRLNERLSDSTAKLEQYGLNEEHKKLTREAEQLRRDITLELEEVQKDLPALMETINEKTRLARKFVKDLDRDRHVRDMTYRANDRIQAIDVDKLRINPDRAVEERAALQAIVRLQKSMARIVAEDKAAIAGTGQRTPIPCAELGDKTPPPSHRRRFSGRVFPPLHFDSSPPEVPKESETFQRLEFESSPTLKLPTKAKKPREQVELESPSPQPPRKAKASQRVEHEPGPITSEILNSLVNLQSGAAPYPPGQHSSIFPRRDHPSQSHPWDADEDEGELD